MSPPWMPLYIADYLADTRRLSAAQHGAYLLLIMEYWQFGELPDDDDQLARIACMNPKEWAAARPVIERLFQPGWRHKRVDEEMAKAHEKYALRAAAGKRGGIAKAASKQNASKRPSNASGNATGIAGSKTGSNALASSSQPHSASHYPSHEERFRDDSGLSTTRGRA